MQLPSRVKCAPSHLLGALLHRIATLILTILTVFLSTSVVKCDEKPKIKGVPNIVLILVDDMGYHVRSGKWKGIAKGASSISMT